MSWATAVLRATRRNAKLARMLDLKLGQPERLYLYRATLLALGVRVGLLLVAYLAGRAILDNQQPFWDMMTEILPRWDAQHLIRVADVGYRDYGEDRFFIVYFPFYPLVLRAVQFFLQDYVVAGLVISLVGSIAAGYFLQALARLDGTEEEANRALWYFFLFPTAYFLVVPYTEALFLALLLGSYYTGRQGNWAWCGVLGMLACATRIQGFAVAPALLYEAYQREGKAGLYRAWWLILVPVGFLIYLGINWVVLEDPLAFFDIQRDHWNHKIIPPWETVWDGFRAFRDSPPSAFRAMIVEALLVAFFFAAALLLLSVRWLRPSYQIFSWIYLLVLMSDTWQISLPRYILAIFPLYFILAKYGERPAVHQAIITAFAVSMGGLFVVFASGRWAF